MHPSFAGSAAVAGIRTFAKTLLRSLLVYLGRICGYVRVPLAFVSGRIGAGGITKVLHHRTFICIPCALFGCLVAFGFGSYSREIAHRRRIIFIAGTLVRFGT